jgi:hypothetical protein
MTPHSIKQIEFSAVGSSFLLSLDIQCVTVGPLMMVMSGPTASLSDQRDYGLGPLLGLGDRDADRLAFVVTLFEQSVGDLDRLQA